MAPESYYSDFEEILKAIGEAGRRVSEIEACEGAAGNISIYIGGGIDPRRQFPVEEVIQLPQTVPELAGGLVVGTGSGRRLREIGDDPEANLGCLVVDPGGETGHLYTSPRKRFRQLTSELNSHLAVHHDQVARTHTIFSALVHAHPPHLTYLSHIPVYRDERYLNRRLLRWEPEGIVNLPEGLGIVPFLVPGSPELMAATVESLRTHRAVVWSKHGVTARSDRSVKRATDWIEYAEAAARYEYLDLGNHAQAEGLGDHEVKAICDSRGISQDIF